MEVTWILIVLVLLCLAFRLLFRNSHDQGRKLPPGPVGIPILGYAPFLKQPIFLAFTDLAKRYGDVYLVQMGQQQFLLLNSYSAIKEAFIDDGDNFAGRLQSPFINRISRSSGILFQDGPLWQEHRRFSLRVLRDFGFGRSRAEDIIDQEADGLVERLNSKTGDPVDTGDLIMRSVANVISCLIVGERPGYDDPNFTAFTQNLHVLGQQVHLLNLLPILFPQLSLIAPIIDHLPSNRKSINATDFCHEYIQQKIADHRKHIADIHNPGDLIDAYLLEQARLNKKGEEHSYTEWQLIRVIFEIFGAGIDTTANSLSWAMLYLALNPQCQARVHAEIESVVGRSGVVSLKQRTSFHIVHAVIDEVLRLSNIAPLGIPHRNLQPTQLRGFHIPADCLILPNLYATHTDERIWERPESFYPEHFLTADGVYKSRDELIPFGIGKRSCLGETLARAELFLFFTRIMQNFKVQLAGCDKLDLKTVLQGTEGIVRAPGDHRIIFEKR